MTGPIRRLAVAGVGAAVLSSASCGPSRDAALPTDTGARTERGTDTVTEIESIGSATMRSDGTLVLQLRAQTGETVGDGYFTGSLSAVILSGWVVAESLVSSIE